MSIETPTRKNVSDKFRNDVQSELPDSNPFLKNSFINAMIVGLSGRVFDYYLQLNNFLFPNLFPDTATGSYLERWGSYMAITRNPAIQAIGNITCIGTAGTSVAAGTQFQNSNSISFLTTQTGVVAAEVVNVSNISLVGLTATATTPTSHGLTTGLTVTIAGANETDYNGDFVIAVQDETTFSYSITGTPATPATGTITASADMISLPVQAVEYGTDGNSLKGEQLTISTPIAGIDNTAFVGIDGISGGTEQESDEDLRIRIIYRYANPISHFNSSEIINQAKLVSGVTRVWVEETTPALGQVTIYFVRDNDTDIIPSAQEILDVKTKVLEIKPANTADIDVIVSAPTAVPVPFTFSTILPDTDTMKIAVASNLQAYFTDEVEVGVNIGRVEYQSAIYNTIDPETGDKLQSFTLNTPTIDITIATGEIGTLGTVTF